MSRVSVLSAITCVALASGVAAQQALYAQCGGLNWTGGTTCVAGATCIKQNDCKCIRSNFKLRLSFFDNAGYSQCLPGTATTVSSTTTSTSTSTTRVTTSTPTTTTTSSSAPAPTGVKYWFSFGDSYTQTGFDISGTLPAVGNALGNPTYPGYTACGSGKHNIHHYRGRSDLPVSPLNHF